MAKRLVSQYYWSPNLPLHRRGRVASKLGNYVCAELQTIPALMALVSFLASFTGSGVYPRIVANAHRRYTDLNEFRCMQALRRN